MKTHNLLFTAVVVFASASGLVAADDDASKIKVDRQMTDARLETQISTTFALSPFLRANDLQVSVQDGKATLTGKVDEEVNKDFAKQIALGVNGIKTVNNDIEIIPGYTPASSSEARSFGDYIDDASVTAAVKSKLLWSKHAEGLSANVDTKFGKVTLTGTATTPMAKEFANRLALNTDGVTSVDNQITIDPEGMTDKAKSGSDRNAANANGNESEQPIADTWITTKVKSTFMYSRNINGSDIAVDTNNGIVNLNGKVDSGAERELAIELAENIRGVKSVEASKLTQ